MGKGWQGATPDLLLDAPLPENVEMERLVLGYVLTTPSGYAKVAESLTADDFSPEKHKRIFSRMSDLAKRGGHIDRVTLTEELNRNRELALVDGMAYVASLDDGLPPLVNIEQYCRIVREKSMARRIALLCETTAISVTEQVEDIRTLADTLMREVRKTMERVEQGSPELIGDYIKRMAETGQDLYDPSRSDPGMMFGLPQFDEATGGLHVGETAIIAAGPGEGKTALLYQICRHNVKAGDREGILILSLEMRKRSIFNRFACAMAGIPIQQYRKGLDNPKDRLKFGDAVEELRALPIYFEDTPGLDHVQVRNKVEATLMRQPLKVVGLDFIQLANGTSARMSENERLTEFCNHLQRMTMSEKLKIRSILLSQLSRDNRKLKQKPGLHSLRGSGTIEQVGNIIAFLHYEDQFRPENRGLGTFLLSKNREGESNLEIPFRFYGWRGYFEERERHGMRTEEVA